MAFSFEDIFDYCHFLFYCHALFAILFGIWAFTYRWTTPTIVRQQLDTFHITQPIMMLITTFAYAFESSEMFRYLTRDIAYVLAILLPMIFVLIRYGRTVRRSPVPSLTQFIFPSYQGLIQWAAGGELSPLIVMQIDNASRGTNAWPNLYEEGFGQNLLLLVTATQALCFMIVLGPPLVDAALFVAANMCYNAFAMAVSLVSSLWNSVMFLLAHMVYALLLALSTPTTPVPQALQPPTVGATAGVASTSTPIVAVMQAPRPRTANPRPRTATVAAFPRAPNPRALRPPTDVGSTSGASASTPTAVEALAHAPRSDSDGAIASPSAVRPQPPRPPTDVRSTRTASDLTPTEIVALAPVPQNGAGVAVASPPTINPRPPRPPTDARASRWCCFCQCKRR